MANRGFDGDGEPYFDDSEDEDQSGFIVSDDLKNKIDLIQNEKSKQQKFILARVLLVASENVDHEESAESIAIIAGELITMTIATYKKSATIECPLQDALILQTSIDKFKLCSLKLTYDEQDYDLIVDGTLDEIITHNYDYRKDTCNLEIIFSSI